jgi:hypothetical protein
VSVGRRLARRSVSPRHHAWASIQSPSQTLKDERHINFHHHIEIEDEHGNVLETVRFKDVAKIES